MIKEDQIVFICGYFEKKYENIIRSRQNAPLDYSANNVQERLICGFKKNISMDVLSAPFVGSFPKESKTVFFDKLDTSPDIQYVSFNNVWGLRNYSRAVSLKKKIDKLIEKKSNQVKSIVVYSTHTPLLEAAVYAKRRNSDIKICLIVPDLPQYINLNKDVSGLYRLAKKYDASHFYKLCRYVDSYLFFAPEMKKMFDISGKKVFVSEGFLDDNIFEVNEAKRVTVRNKDKVKYIVYTGTTNERFGVKDLVDAFKRMEGSNYRLVICGSGDTDGYIKKSAADDKRIMALGQVSPDESRLWQLKADVLINPRPNDEEFTKYSFPSKNLEYLASGSPVAAYLLDGMPKEYEDFIFCIEDSGDHVKDIRDSILKVIENPDNSCKYHKFKTYAKNKLLVSSVVSKILEG